MAFGDHLGNLTATNVSLPNPFIATGSVVVAVGDLVVVQVSQQTNITAAAVTDNLGHTYTAIGAGTDAGTATLKNYYIRITTAGTLTSVSAVTTASTNDGAIAAACFAGPFAVGPLDSNPAPVTADVTSPFTCAATGVLAQADELVVICASSFAATVDWLATLPMTMRVNGLNASTSAVVYLASKVVSATTTTTDTFTGTNPTQAVLVTLSFKKDAVVVPTYFAGPDANPYLRMPTPIIGY